MRSAASGADCDFDASSLSVRARRLQRLLAGVGNNPVFRQHCEDALAFGSGRGNSIKHRSTKVGAVSSVRSCRQKQCHETVVPSLHGAVQDGVPSVRTSIRIRTVAKEHIRDVGMAQHRYVDQWGITKFIDGVDIGATFREKPDAVCKSFDSQKVKNRLAVQPTCFDEIRMRGQQAGCSLLVSN